MPKRMQDLPEEYQTSQRELACYFLNRQFIKVDEVFEPGKRDFHSDSFTKPNSLLDSGYSTFDEGTSFKS